MKTYSLLLVFALSSLNHAQDSKALETALQAKFKDKTVTLKHFYVCPYVHLDPSGVPRQACEVGPWTLYSSLRVANVKVSDSSLRIEGKRIAVGFEERKIKYFNTDDLSLVEMDLDGPLGSANVNHALIAIVMTPSDHFEDYVPYYWKHFLQQNRQPDPTARHSQQSDMIPGRVDDPAGPIVQRLKVSSGVLASKNIKKSQPTYPSSAKSRGAQGTVVFRVIVGRNGKVMYLRIEAPAGLGLDEAAMDAVKDWEYQPMILNGVPVEVESLIIVNFSLFRLSGPVLGPRPN